MLKKFGLYVSLCVYLSYTNKEKQNIMKTLETIKELEAAVKGSKTYETSGRQVVADSCRKLYNLIESGLKNKFGQAAIEDAFKDLCNGDFAEPFVCEKKKDKFELYKSVFVNNVI